MHFFHLNFAHTHKIAIAVINFVCCHTDAVFEYICCELLTQKLNDFESTNLKHVCIL